MFDPGFLNFHPLFRGYNLGVPYTEKKLKSFHKITLFHRLCYFTFATITDSQTSCCNAVGVTFMKSQGCNFLGQSHFHSNLIWLSSDRKL